jgi:hypothetical protein
MSTSEDRTSDRPEQRSRRAGPRTAPGRSPAEGARCDRTAQAITGFAGGPKLWLKAHYRQAVIRRLFVRFM